MPLTRSEKEHIVSELDKQVGAQAGMVFADFRGLANEGAEELRGKLAEADATFRVAKKTLLKLAFGKHDEALAGAVDEIEGQLAVIFAWSDPIAVAKAVHSFSEEYEGLAILGGYYGGAVQSADQIEQLAKLPSAEELRARLVSTIANPLNEFAYVMNAPIGQLVQVLSAAAEGEYE